MTETSDRAVERASSVPDDVGPQDEKPAAKRTRKAAAAKAEPSPAAATKDDPDGSQRRWSAQAVWERLVAPFPEDWVERLPKPLSKNDDRKGRCVATDAGNQSPVSADGHHCGGWHSRAVHLDYVGHAGITMRLNDVLGPQGWDFTPYAHDQQGSPLLDRSTFWATLTIRVGDQEVSKSDLAANYNGPQEAYGDALRRCAMRFGLGTYLWSKSEQAHQRAIVHDVPPEPEPEAQDQGQADPPPELTNSQLLVNQRILSYPRATAQKLAAWWNGNNVPAVGFLTDQQAAWVMAYLDKRDAEGWADPPA